jgi:hypothetical protein
MGDGFLPRHSRLGFSAKSTKSNIIRLKLKTFKSDNYILNLIT